MSLEKINDMNEYEKLRLKAVGKFFCSIWDSIERLSSIFGFDWTNVNEYKQKLIIIIS